MTGERDLERRVLTLEALVELSQSFIVHSKLEDLSSFLLLTLIGQFSFTRGAIFLERAGRFGELSAIAARGIDLAKLEHCGLSWHSGTGRAARARGEFIELADPASGARDPETLLLVDQGFRTAIPLAAKGRPIGLVLVGERIHDRALSELDRQMLSSTLEIAAVAIENSLLNESLRRSNEELTQKNARLEEMDRLRGEFLQNTSHELRTPLTCIVSYAECLKMREVDMETRVDFSDRILVQSQKQLEMIDRLLALSSLSTSQGGAEHADADVNALLSEEVARWREIADRKGIALVLAASPDAGAFDVDESRTRESVRCLLDNAIKFTPEGGRVEVACELSGGEILIHVHDTGIGMAPKDHATAFEPFVQLDGSMTRAYSGIGIGLTLARELAELQGGRITVRSAVGQGSTFTIHLPARSSRTLASSSPPEAQPVG
jgi:signal transduction histidine kinase